MPQLIREIMTQDVVALDATQHVDDAARQMRDEGIGDVLVTFEGKLHGIVTDRDIVVRCVATGGNPASMTLRDVCTQSPRTLRPDDDVRDAVRLMKEHAVRRVPVIAEGGKPVGFVSMGDLAEELDRDSALGRVSAAPPTH